jgi:hypothetical protein
LKITLNFLKVLKEIELYNPNSLGIFTSFLELPKFVNGFLAKSWPADPNKVGNALRHYTAFLRRRLGVK